MDAALDSSRIGESEAARAFGATVRVETPDRGLCLVVGRPGEVDEAVVAAGGRLVARPAGGRLLVLVTWTGLRKLWRDPAVAAAGPVSVDPERFQRFCAVAGLDGADTTAPTRAQEA